MLLVILRCRIFHHSIVLVVAPAQGREVDRRKSLIIIVIEISVDFFDLRARNELFKFSDLLSLRVYLVLHDRHEYVLLERD